MIVYVVSNFHSEFLLMLNERIVIVIKLRKLLIQGIKLFLRAVHLYLRPVFSEKAVRFTDNLVEVA